MSAGTIAFPGKQPAYYATRNIENHQIHLVGDGKFEVDRGLGIEWIRNILLQVKPHHPLSRSSTTGRFKPGVVQVTVVDIPIGDMGQVVPVQSKSCGDTDLTSVVNCFQFPGAAIPFRILE